MAVTVFAVALSGCASPGPARPPSLHLPRPVTDLAATRTGDQVVLHWTTPEKTTDGLKVQPAMTAEICREIVARHAACTPVKRIAVRPGPSTASDTLPAAFTSDPATLLAYRVQIVNAKGRSAGLSSPAFAAAGTAPPPVEHLQATPIRNGAMLEWQPRPVPAFVDLDRVLVQAPTSGPAAKKKTLQLSASVPTEIHLRASGPTFDSGHSADPGGTIDPVAQRGATYRYTAQRVRSVVLRGHALEIRSAPSPAVTVAMRDVFPPKAPVGLAAVPSTGSIDLSWEPNTEPDLAGYLVYRQAFGADGLLSGTATLLTPKPDPTPGFSDRTAVVGQTYSYRVIAVDTTGNRSPASNEARESLRRP